MAEINTDTSLAVTMARRLRRVRLEQQVSAEPLMVRGDAVQLHQVLVNLMLNGMDATNDISFHAAKVEILAERTASGEIRLKVSDNGCGFANAQQLGFASFVSTKPHGMGLGLSISNAIIQAHGGRLLAYNNPEGGATVSFHLPPPIAAQ